jgi:hypothetical protein
VDRVVRGICLELLKDCTLGTPVDTGRARANWQASIDVPAEGTIEKDDKAGGSTVRKGQSSVKQATGRVWWLTNNLPYIYRLEFEGHSPQAPQGWVRSAIERAKTFARRASAIR